VGLRVRLGRALLQFCFVALVLLILGVVLLVKSDYFLGILCLVGSICIVLVISTIGAALRRRGFFQRKR
jgi:hypothetical protein